MDRILRGRSSAQVFMAVIGTAGLLGCNRPSQPQSASSNQSAPAPTPVVLAADAPAPALVDYQDKGTHFQYPNNWKPKPDKDYELHLVPADGAANRDITFDIPDLPPHFPGMIRIGLIENGYTGDLKKQHKDLHIDSAADFALKDSAAKARLVISSWNQNGTKHDDVGLLIMRKEVVYILSCNADEKDLPAVRADFDKIVSSLRWDK